MGLLAALGLACGLRPDASAEATGGRSAVKIEISVPKETFVQGERIDVDVLITNDTGAAVELPLPSDRANWQPRYSLRAAGSDGEHGFSHRSVELGDDRADPEGATPVLATLEPGERFEYGFTLTEWQPASDPDEYTLEATLRWRDVDARSQPVKFQIVENTYLAAAGSADVSDHSTLRVAWLGEGAEHRHLGEALFYEKRPDLGELQGLGSRMWREVGPGATEASIPSAGYERDRRDAFWLAWREGKLLRAWTGGASEPQWIALDGAKAALVQPTLLPPSGELLAFVLSEDRGRISLVRFGPWVAEGTPHAPAEVASVRLPFAAQAGSAVLAPEALGSGARAVLVGGEPGAATIALWDGAGDGVRLARLGDVTARSSSRPAVRVDEEGSTHVAVVVLAESATGPALAEARFPADGEPEVSTRPLPVVEPALAQAAVAFDLSAPDRRGTSWLLVLEDGRAVSSGSAGSAFDLPRPPAQPLQLLRTGSNAYVVTLDPATGPGLFALP